MDNTATLLQLRALFDQKNIELFGGKLPPVALKIDPARTRFGFFQSRPTPTICISAHHLALNPFHRVVGLAVRISVEETLVHEMVHLELWLSRKYCGHGAPFKERMASLGYINTRLGGGQMPKGTVVYKCPKCQQQWRRFRRWSRGRRCAQCQVAVQLVEHHNAAILQQVAP
jgi:predicted SprT family Zn-dependent metalloprotease